jgi:two-component system OmpR family sensor kinase
MTLKARLTVGFALLLTASVGAIGVVTITQTRTALVAQVDDLVLSSSARQPSPPRDRRPPREVAAAGEERFRPVAALAVGPSGTLLAAEPAGFSDDPLALPATPDPGELDALESSVGTIDGDGTAYRATARPLPSGGWLVLAAPLGEVDEAVERLIAVFLVTGLVVLVAGGGLAWGIVRRDLRPVDDMIDTASAIAAGDLSQRIEQGDDGTELGRLASALDEMLARLDDAFADQAASEARLRRFVGDASHELRTPLTAIGGYAQLYRQGGLTGDGELDRAMQRIDGESRRMGALVEDMLTLARLDRPQPLELRSVNLSSLARDAADDLQATDPERPVSVDAATQAIVLGDEARLRQVLGNLVANARDHTPAVTPVSIAVRAEADEVVMVVADGGPGLPDGVGDQVFERFYRADESRTRSTGGAGLGLAIVAAIVEAHGGSVSVESSAVDGATFTVRLPPPPA